MKTCPRLNSALVQWWHARDDSTEAPCNRDTKIFSSNQIQCVIGQIFPSVAQRKDIVCLRLAGKKTELGSEMVTKLLWGSFDTGGSDATVSEINLKANQTPMTIKLHVTH